MTYCWTADWVIKLCPLLFSHLGFLTVGEDESTQLAFPKLMY